MDKKSELGSDGPGQVSDKSHSSRPLIRRWWLIVCIVVIAAAAAGGAFFMLRGSASKTGRPVPAPVGMSGGSPDESIKLQPGDLTVTVAEELLRNAGIQVENVGDLSPSSGVNTGIIRTTGTVEPDQYKETPVFPIAGGIVRQVNVELGKRVKAGETLAIIFSTELADAQANYLKLLAEAEEHHLHYRRSVELLEIGALSREELEKATSVHKTSQANVSSAKQKLILLGMNNDQIAAVQKPDNVHSLMAVTSPVSGVIRARAINTGEIVDKGKELFRVVNLNTVWIIARVYESDFPLVTIGSPTTITASALPGRTFDGKVSYIDPALDPQTRTALIRIEIPNPEERLRFGMYVDVSLGATGKRDAGGVRAPKTAIQQIGLKPVVYIATGEPGVFIQREVTTGPDIDGMTSIFSGLKAGDRIVTEGGFLLRAESLRVNPSQPTEAAMNGTSGRSEGSGISGNQIKRPDSATSELQSAITVSVTQTGFSPETIRLRKGVPARITFIRRDEKTCGTEVVIPEYAIRRALPLNEPVVVELRPSKTGEYTFNCGMEMIKGKLIVK